MAETPKAHNGETRGKRIPFKWVYQDDQIRITAETLKVPHSYSVGEIHDIIVWLARKFQTGWFPLANNVEKLGKEEEINGLGVAIIQQRPEDVVMHRGHPI